MKNYRRWGEKLHQKEEELKERELLVQLGEQTVQKKVVQQKI